MNRYLGAERYELTDRLGHGGMATVYSARDLKLDRDVAIKLLADNLAGDDEVRRRFSREARLAAKLDHPNIVQVFDVGEDDGRPFIVMEQVDGGTLGDRLNGRRRSIPRGEALHLLCQLCDGLGHAHAKKLVHRDIKPQNLLLRTSDGCLKITDFGIARAAEETTRLTQAGKVIGTERYMAPEQLADGRITPAADVYACGVVADEVLPQSRPPELREIVERCLREDPADRFTDARSLGEALATVDGDGEAGAVRRGPLAGSADPAASRDRAGDEQLARSGRDRPAPPLHRGPHRGDRGGARDRRRRRPDRHRLGRIGHAQQGREQPAASGARRLRSHLERPRGAGAATRRLLPRPVALTRASSSGPEPWASGSSASRSALSSSRGRRGRRGRGGRRVNGGLRLLSAAGHGHGAQRPRRQGERQQPPSSRLEPRDHRGDGNEGVFRLPGGVRRASPRAEPRLRQIPAKAEGEVLMQRAPGGSTMSVTNRVVADLKPLLTARAGASRKAMAYSAAGMFGGATFVGLLENALPEGQRSSPIPSLIALEFVAVLVYWGPRFPIWALASLGPIGAALIGVAIATTNGHGDGATLFAWPALES